MTTPPPPELRPLPPGDRPALEAAPAGDALVLKPKRPDAWVPFRDGTLRLVKVLGWRQDPGGWAVLLRWGIAGRVTAAWYRYDTERVEETG